MKCMTKQVEAFIKRHDVQPDTYDYKSVWDSSLNAKENFELIRADLKEKGLWTNTEKEVIDVSKEAEQEVETQMKYEILKLEEDILKKAREQKVESVEVENFKPAKDIINAIITGKSEGVYGCIVEGEGGLGKTFLVEKELKESKVNYEKLSGHTTALGLFTFIQKNNDKDVILIDDISATDLRNDDISSLLKSILWSSNNSRILRWTTFRTAQALRKEGLSAVFEVKPKFILVCNEFPDSADSRAVKSRCLYKKFSFTRAEKISIMYHIAKSVKYKKLEEEERIEVVDYIKDNTAVYSIGLDLRSLVKAFYLRTTRENWKTLVDDMFEVDEELKGIHNGMADNQWCEHFGRSRATYFRKKKQYQGLIGNVGKKTI